MIKKIGLLVACILMSSCLYSRTSLHIGAEQFNEYLPLLQGKRIAVASNHTSLIGQTHLVDSLLALQINVVKILCPEHGFRGQAEAGEQVSSAVDMTTGLPVISLYGNHKKPQKADLQDIDIVVFDIQDVGVRFFTYTSTLHYIMEACAENKVSLIVLDRPNPNGHYVDGPVLQLEKQSFIGMHPVPVVHGMTIGEYARMINGESWLAGGIQCPLTVIPCQGYTHQTRYDLSVGPSPNLQCMKAIYLYPSICWFEGTTFSLGRGTDFPFMVFGHPSMKNCEFHFTPRNIPGVATNPPQLGKDCCGFDLRVYSDDDLYQSIGINLSWLLFAYQNFPDKKQFFIPFFDNLAGNTQLRQQILRGLSETEIRESWAMDLAKYQIVRAKYLIYD